MTKRGCGSCLVAAILLVLLALCILHVPWPFIPRAYDQLLHAARWGDLKTIDALLRDKKINVNARYYEGVLPSWSKLGTRHTAINMAAMDVKPEAILLLLAYGADPWLQDSWGRNALRRLKLPLMLSIHIQDPLITRSQYAMAAMILTGAKKQLGKYEAYNLADCAILTDNPAIMRRVSKMPGVDMFSPKHLEFAIDRGRLPAVYWLAREMSQKDRTLAAGKAVQRGSVAPLQILLQLGVDVAAGWHEEGSTLLHLAVPRGESSPWSISTSSAIIRELLKWNAPKDAKDRAGKMPRDYTTVPEILEML